MISADKIDEVPPEKSGDLELLCVGFKFEIDGRPATPFEIAAIMRQNGQDATLLVRVAGLDIFKGPLRALCMDDNTLKLILRVSGCRFKLKSEKDVFTEITFGVKPPAFWTQMAIDVVLETIPWED